MKLYSITEKDVSLVLMNYTGSIEHGKQEIVASLEKFSYPIKVVFEQRAHDIFIRTCYPLKRARNEN